MLVLSSLESFSFSFFLFSSFYSVLLTMVGSSVTQSDGGVFREERMAMAGFKLKK